MSTPTVTTAVGADELTIPVSVLPGCGETFADNASLSTSRPSKQLIPQFAKPQPKPSCQAFKLLASSTFAIMA